MAKLLNLNASFPGQTVFELGESDRRERNYYIYEYDRGDWSTKGYLDPIDEFTVDKSPYEAKSGRVTRKLRSPVEPPKARRQTSGFPMSAFFTFRLERKT